MQNQFLNNEYDVNIFFVKINTILANISDVDKEQNHRWCVLNDLDERWGKKMCVFLKKKQLSSWESETDQIE